MNKLLIPALCLAACGKSSTPQNVADDKPAGLTAPGNDPATVAALRAIPKCNAQRTPGEEDQNTHHMRDWTIDLDGCQALDDLLGEPDAKVAATLINALGETDETIRYAAAHELGTAKLDAVDARMRERLIAAIGREKSMYVASELAGVLDNLTRDAVALGVVGQLQLLARTVENPVLIANWLDDLPVLDQRWAHDAVLGAAQHNTVPAARARALHELGASPDAGDCAVFAKSLGEAQLADEAVFQIAQHADLCTAQVDALLAHLDARVQNGKVSEELLTDLDVSGTLKPAQTQHLLAFYKKVSELPGVDDEVKRLADIGLTYTK